MAEEAVQTEVNDSETGKQPLSLVVDVQTVSACQRHVSVTVPRQDIDRYMQQQFDEIFPKAELPGFRPGKAPRKLVEAKFRKQVSEQVKGSLLMDSLAQMADEQKFAAISEPDLDYEQVKVPDTGDLTFEFNIEVRPEFDMPQWKGMEIKQIAADPTPEQIDRTIELIGERMADLVPVDDAVQAGDTVTVNLQSSYEGEVISSAGEVSLKVLPTLSFPDGTLEGFEKLMVGARAGESRTASVVVGDFSDREDLQGKTLQVEIEILDVKRTEKPTVEQIAEKHGCKSEGEFRDLLISSIRNQNVYEQNQMVRQQISEALTESATWELPPDLLRRQFRRELNRATMEMRSAGMSDAEIQLRENSLRRDAMRETEKLLKEHFILERIAEEQKIEEAPEDYEREIERIAQATNDSVRRVRARLERTGQLDAVRNMIIERKVIDLIKENAKISVVPAKLKEKSAVSSTDFFLCGESISDIPEAKFDDRSTPQQAQANASTIRPTN